VEPRFAYHAANANLRDNPVSAAGPVGQGGIVKTMSTANQRDRYFFGSLESSAKNQEKLREVTYGDQQPEGILLASLDSALNWARKSSVWPMTFGLASR
jgi:hypothetical protein